MIALLLACGLRTETWEITATSSSREYSSEVAEHNFLDATWLEGRVTASENVSTRARRALVYVEGDHLVAEEGWSGTRDAGQLALAWPLQQTTWDSEGTDGDYFRQMTYTLESIGDLAGSGEGGQWTADGQSEWMIEYVFAESDTWTSAVSGGGIYHGDFLLDAAGDSAQNTAEADDCAGDTCIVVYRDWWTEVVEWDIVVDPAHGLDLPADRDESEEGTRSEIELTWGDTELIVTVTGGYAGGTWLGIAETGSGEAGWYGEDCYAGTGGWLYCHEVTGGATLGYVDDIGNVVAGAATLFDQELAFDEEGNDRLTYMLLSGAQCWVWGHDPAYYDELGCEPL